MTSPATASAATPGQPGPHLARRPWPRSRRPRARRASRRQHMIGVIPWREDRLAPCGSRPRRSRRRAPGARSGRRSRSATLSLASIAGDTSPVNAPFSSQWQCCAPRMIDMLVGLDRRLHRAQVGERRVHRHVDGAQSSSSPSRYDSFCTVCDRLEVVVVHLPVAADQRLAVSHSSCSLRIGGTRRRASRPGQVALLEQLERGAAAGGDVVDAVGQAELRRPRPRCRRRRRP